MVFTRDKTLDQHELATYSKEVPATLAGHEVKVLALYGLHDDLDLNNELFNSTMVAPLRVLTCEDGQKYLHLFVLVPSGWVARRS